MTNSIFKSPLSFISLLLFISCGEYLTVKPNKRLTVPSKGSDLQAVLDRVTHMNYNYPVGMGDIASDDFFLTDDDWASRPVEFRNHYTWQRQPVNVNIWSGSYTSKIFYSNTVIDLIDEVEYGHYDERIQILASAHFFRGFGFFNLAQIFAAPYLKGEDNSAKMGIVLRTNADITEPSQRSNLEETYEQIISDLKFAAVNLTPEKHLYPTRPTKAAAYGALARCYLAMQDYPNALNYADSCLLLHESIVDFNNVDASRMFPFEKFNDEVVFYAETNNSTLMSSTLAKIDTILYNLYEEADLRKHLFFSKNGEHHVFTGDYSRNSNAVKFCGITSAEMLLIKAECLQRLGDGVGSMEALNHLLMHRTQRNIFQEFYTDDGEVLLKRILLERRKELIFRGLRWVDIRRLCNDPKTAVVLKRRLNGDLYQLTPDDQISYSYLLPLEIIDKSGIPQN